MRHIRFFLRMLFCIFLSTHIGCAEFLSLKPDKQLATPRTGQDLQAMLDNVSRMNHNLPSGVTAVGADDLFLSSAVWNSIPEVLRMDYNWAELPLHNAYWNTPYRALLNLNTILDELENVTFVSEEERRRIKGSALFLRGYFHYDLAQVFAPPYHRTTLEMPGIPVRQTSDINVVPRRETVSRTYELVVSDLIKSVSLLPSEKPAYPTRPYRGAAYAALARCHLAMGQYDQALLYADSALQLQHVLLDYNDIEPGRPYPFEKYNPEVIFYSQMTGNGGLDENRARVDTNLYDLFMEADHRKTLFFSQKPDGYFSFTGDYAQSAGAAKFNGLTTAEMRLIRIECSLRAGRKEIAISDLNVLAAHRYGMHLPEHEGLTDNELMQRALDERRREMLYRGTRWSDIRRFSFEEGRTVDVKRVLNNEEFSMDASRIQRFAYFIPQSVIDMGGISQNE